MKTRIQSLVRSLFSFAAVSALAVAAQAQPTDDPQTILFVGNSFTQGANSAVLRYRPASVDDLANERVGGIPALFPVSKTAWWRGINEGRYPKPVKLAARTTAWRAEDIRALLQASGGAA